jgi:acyl-CoA thioester hydrolase
LSERPARPAPQLADYPHVVREAIRYRDLDPQGHVNNAVFATFFESGRVALFRDPDLGIGVPGATFVLARTEIDFLKELRWPGTVAIGTSVTGFGRSSFRVAQALFHDEVCAATGLATMVFMDLASRRSRPLPDDVVARLRRSAAPGAEA